MSDFKFACPQCQQHIQCDVGYAGMEIGCPTCSTRIIVPQPIGGPSPPPPPPPALSIAPPPAPAPSRPVPAPATRPQPQRPVPPKPRSSDGWSTDESGLNKVGMYIVIIAAIGGAILSGALFEVNISPLIVCGVVAGCGVIGGALNVLGRGPIWAGMCIGLVFALGAYGVVYWWLSFRGDDAYDWEVFVAFMVGALPGICLQVLLQKMIQKRSGG